MQSICSIVLVFFYVLGDLNGSLLHRIRRATDGEIRNRLPLVGSLTFDTNPVPLATIPRRFACFFVFDKEASNDLNNNSEIADAYATYLATMATRYAAHGNIQITNAGVEMWSDADRISFALEPTTNAPMENFLSRFQAYQDRTKGSLFGSVYTVGVLISKKDKLVRGGFAQGPANTSSGAVVMWYRPSPWSIAALLAHELLHTISVIHPDQLEMRCEECPQLPFCPAVTSKPIPDECLCNFGKPLGSQCLMTFFFGSAVGPAPRYTSCDIQMMNFYYSNATCQRT